MSSKTSVRSVDESEFFPRIRSQLYSAVINDTLDELGHRQQAMNPKIRPLSSDFVIAGRARTVLWVDVYAETEDPYAKEIEAIDSLKPGDVSVTCTNQSLENAPWGELISTAAQARGAAGAIVDGLVRDSLKILKMGFPVFCSGLRPVDSRGRGVVVDYDVPVKVGGVLVRSGDIVFADNDGVVVIPQGLEERVFGKAMEKVNRENLSRKELREGKLLREVYDRYGVL